MLAHQTGFGRERRESRECHRVNWEAHESVTSTLGDYQASTPERGNPAMSNRVSSGDHGSVDSRSLPASKPSVMRRITLWIRRALKQSDDPESASEYFKNVR